MTRARYQSTMHDLNQSRACKMLILLITPITSFHCRSIVMVWYGVVHGEEDWHVLMAPPGVTTPWLMACPEIISSCYITIRKDGCGSVPVRDWRDSTRTATAFPS